MSLSEAPKISGRHGFTIEENKPARAPDAREMSATTFGPSASHSDHAELLRLGKKPVLKREFGFLSILGFACTVLVSWSSMLTLFLQGFANGGPAGAIYEYIFVWFGTISIFITVSEMASMAPTAGGQYHWVSMLTPTSSRKFLSYITGWCTMTGWQAIVAGSAYFQGTTVQAVAILCNPSYKPTAWQALLLFWAFLAVGVSVNILAPRTIAGFESVAFILYVVGYFAIMIPLVYLAPHGSAQDVFGTFLNNGNWPTQGVSFMVGISSAVISITGCDSAVHLAEEIKNAAVVVPRAMLAGLVINGALALSMIIALVFCLGDVDKVLASADTLIYPYIYIFYQATQSIAGTAVMVSIIILIGTCGLISGITSTSRQMWSFSRDRGVPFWKFTSKLSKRTSIPIYSVLITMCIALALSFIVLGSSVVFNDVISLTNVALNSSYLISTSLFLWRRLAGHIAPHDESTVVVGHGNLMWGRWRLPSALGVANNILAICCLIIFIIFSCFPPSANPDPSGMNYAVLVFGAVVIFSTIWYVLFAKRIYKGPITEVELEKVEGV